MLYTYSNFLQTKLIVKPHGITSVQTQKKKKGHKKLGKRKKGICFFFWQLKATAWSVTKPQIKGLNTELWKLKRNSTHLELNRVRICDDKTVLRVPVSVNRKTWLKGLSGRNTKPEDTYTSMRPETKLELETRNTLQVIASTIILSSAFWNTWRTKAFIKVQTSAPPPCTPGQPPREGRGKGSDDNSCFNKHLFWY